MNGLEKLKNPLKIVLIISIFLNVLFSVVYYNQYVNDKDNYGTGDSSSYRVFIHGLDYFSKFINEIEEGNEKKENMHLLVNADERLNMAVNFIYSI